jgi:hypothetical protein
MHLPSKLLDARSVCSTRVTVLLLDRAGWHTSGHLIVPKNLTLIFLLSRAPELVWGVQCQALCHDASSREYMTI